MDVKRYPRFRRPGHADTGDRRALYLQRTNPLGYDYFHTIVDDQVKSRLSCSVWRSTGRGSQRSSARSRPGCSPPAFTRRPADALLVAEIADLTLDVPPLPGVELRGARSARAGTRVVDGRRWASSSRAAAAPRTLDLAEELDRLGRLDTLEFDSLVLDTDVKVKWMG